MKLIRGGRTAASHDACQQFRFTSRNPNNIPGAPGKTGAARGGSFVVLVGIVVGGDTPFWPFSTSPTLGGSDHAHINLPIAPVGGGCHRNTVCEFPERSGRRFGAGRVPSDVGWAKISETVFDGSLALLGD